MTEELISIEALQEKLDVIAQDIANEQWKYYHIESIRNFIHHLNSFPSQRTQERKASEINNYLTLVREKMNEEYDLHDLYKELFPTIWKISRDYVDVLGFVSKPSPVMQLLLGVILFFVLKSVFGSLIAFVCVAIFWFTVTIRSVTRLRAKKYY